MPISIFLAVHANPIQHPSKHLQHPKSWKQHPYTSIHWYSNHDLCIIDNRLAQILEQLRIPQLCLTTSFKRPKLRRPPQFSRPILAFSIQLGLVHILTFICYIQLLQPPKHLETYRWKLPITDTLPTTELAKSWAISIPFLLLHDKYGKAFL